MINPPLQTVTEDGKVLVAHVHQWATAEVKGLVTLASRLAEAEQKGWEVFGVELIGQEQQSVLTPGKPPGSAESIIWALILRRPRWEHVGNLSSDGHTVIPLAPPQQGEIQSVVPSNSEDNNGKGN